MRAPTIAGMLLFASSILLLTACAEPDSRQPAAPAAAAPATEPKSESAVPPAMAARKDALAPIETAEIVVRESAPPQYALRVVSGLPSGCAQFSRMDVKRQDTVVDVTVWNTVPADSNVMCTMIYGTADNTADLGADFKSGQTYSVRVNGEQKTQFTAQ